MNPHRIIRTTVAPVAFIAFSGSLQADETPLPSPSGSFAAGVADDQRLEDIDVVASVPASPVDATASRLPGTLHETPRSVTVVEGRRIAEQAMKSVTDAMDYAPGVFVNSRNSGGYHYIARGYRVMPSETRVDGFRGLYIGGGQYASPLYGVERIVFLQGPASLLYGAASTPGGLTNVITRKPGEETKTTVDVTATTYAGGGVSFGSHNGVRSEIDTTGSATDDGRLLYRFGIAGESADGYTAGLDEDNRFLSGAFTWKLTEDGAVRLTPLFQFLRADNEAGGGMVVSPSSSLSTTDGSTRLESGDLSPPGVNLYEGGRIDERFIAGFDFDAANDDGLATHVGYRFIASESDIDQWSPVVATAAQRDLLASQGLIHRTQTRRQAANDSHNLDINASGESFVSDDFRNRILVGLGARYVDASARNATGSLATPQGLMDVHTGQGAGVTDRSTGWQPWTDGRSLEWNGYLQDQASLLDDQLVATAGLGYGQLHTQGAGTLASDLTYSAALLWNMTKALAAYTSYSTSFSYADPSTIHENAAGNVFTPDPTTGDNKEIGLKYLLPGQRGHTAIAYFWTTRDDVLNQSPAGDLNPNGNRYYSQDGGQAARGVEWSASWNLTRTWSLDGSFAWIDGSYENGIYSEPIAKTPEFSWSLYTRHEFDRGPLEGFSQYVGLVWQDERMGGNGSRSATNTDPLMLPDFYRVDAGLGYRFNDRFRIGLHVNNLLDETIFVDGTTGANIQVAAPRTISLKATYTF